MAPPRVYEEPVKLLVTLEAREKRALEKAAKTAGVKVTAFVREALLGFLPSKPAKAAKKPATGKA